MAFTKKCRSKSPQKVHLRLICFSFWGSLHGSGTLCGAQGYLAPKIDPQRRSQVRNFPPGLRSYHLTAKLQVKWHASCTKLSQTLLGLLFAGSICSKIDSMYGISRITLWLFNIAMENDYRHSWFTHQISSITWWIWCSIVYSIFFCKGLPEGTRWCPPNCRLIYNPMRTSSIYIYHKSVRETRVIYKPTER